MLALKNKIRTVPNWPRTGVMFRDITTLLKNGEDFKQVLDLLTKRYQNFKIDKIVGIESRGFIIGAALADRLGVGFVPIRKKGKLPSLTLVEEYNLEYGKDAIEMHVDAISPGEKVLVVDDLLATGGTSLAACNLVKRVRGIVIECAFVVELPDLNGSQKLSQAGLKIFSLIQFSGK